MGIKEQAHNGFLKPSKLQMDNLVNSIPGGIAIYKITDRFETLYFSDGVAKLSGFTRDEYAAYVKNNAVDIVYEEDKERLITAVGIAIERNEHLDETYRIYRKDGRLVWVRLNGIVMGEEAGVVIFHAVLQLPPRMAQLYDNLVSESKDIIYVSDINNYDLLYINDTGLRAVGKEKGDYSCKKCHEFLFGRSTPCEFCRIAQMNSQSFLERDFTYPINDKIYSLCGKLIDWNGIPAHVEYVYDVTEARLAQQKNAELMRQLQSTMDNLPGGMCVYMANENGFQPVVHNNAFFNIFGYSPEHQEQVLHTTNFLNVHPDDVQTLKEKVYDAIKTGESIEHSYRCFHDLKGTYIWIKMNAVIVAQGGGEKLCYVSYTDVTKEREAQESLILVQKSLEESRRQAQEALERYQQLVNAIPGGIAQYEVKDKKILTRYVSDGICALTGRTRSEREQMDSQDVLSITHQDDLPALLEGIENALAKRENFSFTYRINTKGGDVRWVNLSASYSCGANGEQLYQAVYTDVDKIKKIEQELLENQLRYEVSVKSSGINIWEYDIQSDKLYVVSNSSRIKQNCFYIENYINSTIEHGYVHPNSIPRFSSIFKRLQQGEKEVSEDIWYKTNDETGWWCERVTYTTAFDQNGKPIKAYGAGRDVTREKEAEKKFHEEISFRKALQSSNLASVIVDLTGNRVLEAIGDFDTVKALNGLSADEYFAATLRNITGADMQKEFLEKYSITHLINHFGSGEYVVSMQFTRLYDTMKVYWVNYSAHLIQNPETKHIIAHISCVDITDEKVMQTIMETVTKTDYDFFVVVDGSLNSARDYAVSGGQRLFDEKKPFDVQNEAWIRSCVCPEDVRRVVDECKIENAWKHASAGEPYKFSFSMEMPNGEIRRKQIQFTPISSERKTYLMSRIDANDIYEEQEAAKKTLQKALAAKSRFLSNMSHDMRTPMNAIIGFSQMALEYQDSPAEVLRDAMVKINDSGRYLLNLINNVLDMAKIESSKLTLHPEPIDADELFGSVVASVKPMMEKKNIEFIFETRNFVQNKVALLDKLLTQQIFVNLLSNAAKFTPMGGRVECITESLSFDGKYSKEKITIRDNGCGMSEDFVKKAFLPFEQEYSEENTEQNGTGLGLAIVKNLVELMGGTIQINSKKNAGTEIIIYLTTELVDKSILPQREGKKEAGNFSTEGKRILMCEDHPLNCEIAECLLSKKGFLVEIAGNGAQGVELLSRSPEGYYDAVLMDIRMPVMNGLEAAMAIRALDRKDVKTIPIIAMTANAFDDDVKKSLASGMNAHLAKPIDPEKLYDTLNEFLI